MIKSADRTKKIDPLCPVFGACGGCLYQDIPYVQELAIKESDLRALLEKHLTVTDAIVEPIAASPKPYYYRHRLDIKIIRTRSKDVFMGFSPENGKRLIEVDTCYIAREEIAGYMPQLKQEVIGRLTDKYRQANVVIKTDDTGSVRWGGIGRRSLQLETDKYLFTVLRGRKIFYSLDTFFQANLSILPKLFERLCAFDLWGPDTVLYDLYGGVGLFSIGLADKAGKIYLIEDTAASVTLATFNVNFHQLANIEIIKGRVEDQWAMLLEKEQGARQIAVVDPPRMGLSESALEVIKKAQGLNYLFYLSCNPQALARDLEALIKEGWQLKKIMPFDFFPRTRHLETLVLLNRGTACRAPTFKGELS